MCSAFVISAAITNTAVPLTIRLARLVQALDRTGGRKDHVGEIPRLGGLAVAIGLLFSGGVTSVLTWGWWSQALTKAELAAVALAIGMVFITGLVDDLTELTAAQKFLIESMAASVVIAAGIWFEDLYLPFIGDIRLGGWGRLLTLIWLVGVTNAVNLIDGLDGLAAGVVALIASSLGVYAWLIGNKTAAITMAAIAGACVGFLRHNWQPARIFLGDSGSLLMGFLLAIVSVHASMKASSAAAFLVPLLALGVPVVDTLVVMARRFLGETGATLVGRFRRMFEPDRSHLHYIMATLLGDRRRVVKLIYAMVLASCLVSLVVAATSAALLGLAFVALQVMVVVAVHLLGFHKQIRERPQNQQAFKDQT